MDKNWNYTEANRFFEKEMKSYLNVLSNSDKWYHIWWSALKKKAEFIILFFQLIISEFWSNWYLVIYWIWLFWLIITSLEYEGFKYYKLIQNQEFINSFFTNINPFDKSLLTDKWITWQNFLHKIILIILYWHLLIALKRTTKR